MKTRSSEIDDLTRSALRKLEDLLNRQAEAIRKGRAFTLDYKIAHIRQLIERHLLALGFESHRVIVDIPIIIDGFVEAFDIDQKALGESLRPFASILIGVPIGFNLRYHYQKDGRSCCITYSQESGINIFLNTNRPLGDIAQGIGFLIFDHLTRWEKVLWTLIAHYARFKSLDAPGSIIYRLRRWFDCFEWSQMNRLATSIEIIMNPPCYDLTRGEAWFLNKIFQCLGINLSI